MPRSSTVSTPLLLGRKTAFFWYVFKMDCSWLNFMERYPWNLCPPPVTSVTQMDLSRYVPRAVIDATNESAILAPETTAQTQ